MSRFQSFVFAGLVIGQMLLPVMAHASSMPQLSAKFDYDSHFSSNVFLPKLITPVVTPSVVASPTPNLSTEDVLPQDKKDTIKRFYTSMQDKLSDLIAKLANLADRMDAKVVELKNRSIDTNAIEQSINAAKAKIAEAKVNLADAADKANALVDSTDRKLAFDGLKTAILGVQSSLKIAHELLTDAANQIKTAYQSLLATDSNR